ncbi:hypothetical protein NL676_001654 [Syzygium grande]|nr:hypothetical protein NL676_001654 [Syzygium grande]
MTPNRSPRHELTWSKGNGMHLNLVRKPHLPVFLSWRRVARMFCPVLFLWLAHALAWFFGSTGLSRHPADGHVAARTVWSLPGHGLKLGSRRAGLSHGGGRALERSRVALRPVAGLRFRGVGSRNESSRVRF